ncbi:hypothetical protein JTE90_024889 [Oedothorax gibbosus]|uniref:Uncharacterized protein n=1 Tax=Oedothorax gibbosus TaxID=931172 RepID=A0AAV6V441_9ARAC|nr:hypothetical protein JTE90_024889 [Oedothorax gibbosus]
METWTKIPLIHTSQGQTQQQVSKVEASSQNICRSAITTRNEFFQDGGRQLSRQRREVVRPMGMGERKKRIFGVGGMQRGALGPFSSTQSTARRRMLERKSWRRGPGSYLPPVELATTVTTAAHAHWRKGNFFKKA